jgi:hypothetical protein
MISRAIASLLAEVRARHGKTSVSPCESYDDGHGVYFKVAGIPATFSAHTQDGTLPEGYFDVQVEGIPPGDYLYTEVVGVDAFLELLERFLGPVSEWPTQ